MLASIGVILAGAIIVFTGWLFIDPLVSVLIAALVGWNALKIVGETVNILLEGSPRGMDLSALHKELQTVPSVASHHDLHVWSISSEHKALSVHVVVREQTLAESEQVMRDLESRVCERFSIRHTTIRVEFRQPCAAEADHLLEHNHPHAVGGWITDLDDEIAARRYAAGTSAAVEFALGIMLALPEWQEALA